MFAASHTEKLALILEVFALAISPTSEKINYVSCAFSLVSDVKDIGIK